MKNLILKLLGLNSTEVKLAVNKMNELISEVDCLKQRASEVYVENSYAIELYHSLGFKPEKEWWEKNSLSFSESNISDSIIKRETMEYLEKYPSLFNNVERLKDLKNDKFN